MNDIQFPVAESRQAGAAVHDQTGIWEKCVILETTLTGASHDGTDKVIGG